MNREQYLTIPYYSKTLSPSVKNYCMTRTELLAVNITVKQFRPYLYGKEFKLRANLASLFSICKWKDPAPQIVKCLERLAAFNFNIKHRAAVRHANADGLSRGCIECKQCQGIEKRDGRPTWNEIVEDSTAPFSQQIKIKKPIAQEIPKLQQQRNSETQILYESVVKH